MVHTLNELFRIRHKRNNSAVQSFKCSLVLLTDPPIITEPGDVPLRFATHENIRVRCAAWSKPPSQFIWYKIGVADPLAQGNGTAERYSYIFTCY